VVAVIAVAAFAVLGSVAGLSLARNIADASTSTAPVVNAAPQSPGTQEGSTNTAPVAPAMPAEFLNMMRMNVTFSAWSDSDILALGSTTCGMLDNGAAVGDLISMGAGRNLSPEDTGYVLGAAVFAYCPQHKPFLDELIGG
jgi:hypothetical protein